MVMKIIAFYFISREQLNLILPLVLFIFLGVEECLTKEIINLMAQADDTLLNKTISTDIKFLNKVKLDDGFEIFSLELSNDTELYISEVDKTYVLQASLGSRHQPFVIFKKAFNESREIGQKKTIVGVTTYLVLRKSNEHFTKYTAHIVRLGKAIDGIEWEFFNRFPTDYKNFADQFVRRKQNFVASRIVHFNSNHLCIGCGEACDIEAIWFGNEECEKDHYRRSFDKKPWNERAEDSINICGKNHIGWCFKFLGGLCGFLAKKDEKLSKGSVDNNHAEISCSSQSKCFVKSDMPVVVYVLPKQEWQENYGEKVPMITLPRYYALFPAFFTEAFVNRAPVHGVLKLDTYEFMTFNQNEKITQWIGKFKILSLTDDTYYKKGTIYARLSTPYSVGANKIYKFRIISSKQLSDTLNQHHKIAPLPDAGEVFSKFQPTISNEYSSDRSHSLNSSINELDNNWSNPANVPSPRVFRSENITKEYTPKSKFFTNLIAESKHGSEDWCEDCEPLNSKRPHHHDVVALFCCMAKVCDEETRSNTVDLFNFDHLLKLEVHEDQIKVIAEIFSPRILHKFQTPRQWQKILSAIYFASFVEVSQKTGIIDQEESKNPMGEVITDATNIFSKFIFQVASFAGSKPLQNHRAKLIGALLETVQRKFDAIASFYGSECFKCDEEPQSNDLKLLLALSNYLSKSFAGIIKIPIAISIEQSFAEHFENNYDLISAKLKKYIEYSKATD